MPVEALGDLGARQGLALVGHPLDPQHQARRAEAALQSGGGLEGVGVEAPLVVGDAFEGDDRAAFDLLGPQRAGALRLAVEQDEAGAALVLGRTTRLDRLDLEGFAQDVEEQLTRPGRDNFNFLNHDGWKQFFEGIELDTNLRNVIYKLIPALILELLWTPFLALLHFN